MPHKKIKKQNWNQKHFIKNNYKKKESKKQTKQNAFKKA